MKKAKKILYVSSEIFPFLPQTDMSYIGRHLPQVIQESGGDPFLHAKIRMHQ